MPTIDCNNCGTPKHVDVDHPGLRVRPPYVVCEACHKESYRQAAVDLGLDPERALRAIEARNRAYLKRQAAKGFP